MNPALYVDHIARAYELVRLERYDLALQEVERALAEDPHSAEAHACGAWVLFRQEKFEEAAQAARAALAEDPDLADAYDTLALAYWAMERPLEAEQAFKEALARPDPARPMHLTNYARFLLADDRHKQALATIEEALALAPSLSQAHEARGLALYGLGRTAEAEEAFRTALSLDPRNIDAMNELGRMELAKGNVDVALDTFREALRLRPGDPDAKANFVSALKARQPIYGRLLALTLRSESPGGRFRIGVAAIGFLASFFVMVLAIFVLRSLRLPWDTLVRDVWIAAFSLFMLGYILRAVWRAMADPIFNLLVAFDPLGRHALAYEPTHPVRLGLMALTVAGGIGLVIGSFVWGAGHSASQLALYSIFAGILSLLFLRGTGGMGGRRWLLWGGYALIVLSLYGIAATAAIFGKLYFALVALFLLGVIVYYVGRRSNEPKVGVARALDRRRYVRGLVLWGAFGLASVAMALVLGIRRPISILAIAAGGAFIAEALQLYMGKDTYSQNLQLYRQWVFKDGEPAARRRFARVLLFGSLYLIGLQFLIFAARD